MAHYVGRLLNIRPSEILDTWGTAELIVAFGEYANENAMEAYESWRQAYMPPKGTPPAPKKYAVRFVGIRELEEYDG